MKRHFVYYWKAYWSNIKEGPGYVLNQNSPNMQDIDRNTRVWAITRNGVGKYALVAVFDVDGTGENALGSDERTIWGKWYFRSSKERVIYFSPLGQPTIEPTIRRLGLTTKSAVLGASFQGRQGVQEISLEAARLLEAHARTIGVDTQLSTGEAIRAWEQALPTGEDIEDDGPPERREYLRELALRDRRQVNELRALYVGRCQISGEVPLAGLAGDITEAHHIQWLTRGGVDGKENMVILSPDMHRAIHALDSKFDWSTLSFVMGERRLPLKLNQHLRPKKGT